MELLIENLAEELLKREIRPSYQRIKILEYLLANRCHPTVDRIFNDLVKEIPTLSKSTIYNTINLFVEAGLVRVLTIEDNETRYDITISDHGHFKCDLCGTIFDFSLNIDLINWENKELSEFKIKEKNVYFRGVCPKCLKKK